MVNKEKKVIVLMPPKTASNSIKHSFRESGNLFDKFKKSYSQPKLHLYLSELVEVFKIEDLSEYKVIQIVRNPYDKYISSYFHQMKSVNKAKADIPFKNFDIYNFTIWLSDCLKSDDFEKMFYGDNKFLKNAKKRGTWGGSRLYKNQTDWNDVEGIKTKYFKLEDISKDITPLNKYLGFDINPLPKVNVNKVENNYSQYFNSEIISFIESNFAKDIKTLKYKNGMEYKSDSTSGKG
jgi:hypothetical protein